MNKRKYYNAREVTSIKQIMEIATKEAGDKNAFKYRENKKDITITYNEFENDIESLGTGLACLGMHEKHIAVIGENSYKWLTVYLTALKSTGVFVPIDRELSIDGIINILKHSDSEILFYSEKFEEMIDEIHEKVPKIKFFIGFSRTENDKCKLSYDDFKENGKKVLEQGSKIYTDLKDDVNNLKMIVYTSGTTGEPKGVMLSEKNLVSVVYNALLINDVKTCDLSILPYHHTFEAVAGILVSINRHACICINDSLKNVVKNLQKYKPDYILVVPVFIEMFYKNIWKNAKKTGQDKKIEKAIRISNALRKVGIDFRRKIFKSILDVFGGNLQEIICGGAPIRPEVGKFFNDIGIDLYNGYGITECSPLVSVNNKFLNDCSTVGVLMPCCEIKFENINENGDGEICVKGSNVMLGYYKDKEKTEKVLKDGWFNTEDYGSINKKGQLIINGRKKNIIVLNNGKNIYPEELENLISGINYVQEVVVRGIKNSQDQEIGLMAEVFLSEEYVKKINSENIEKKLKEDINLIFKELPTYKHITKIKIRDKEFDKTTTNKIKR